MRRLCWSVVRATIVFVVASFSSVVASGQGRTDVITLVNGDRMTGEIMRLERGRLELKTDNAGTIDIEWDTVASIEARREFEVATTDGRLFLGTLGRSARPAPRDCRTGRSHSAGDVRGHGHCAHWRELMGEARWVSRCGIQLHTVERDCPDGREHGFRLSPAGVRASDVLVPHLDATLRRGEPGRSRRDRFFVRTVPRATLVRQRRGAAWNRTRAWAWSCGHRWPGRSVCAS